MLVEAVVVEEDDVNVGDTSKRDEDEDDIDVVKELVDGIDALDVEAVDEDVVGAIIDNAGTVTVLVTVKVVVIVTGDIGRATVSVIVAVTVTPVIVVDLMTVGVVVL